MSELTKQGRFLMLKIRGEMINYILGDIGELKAHIHVQQDFYAINSVLYLIVKRVNQPLFFSQIVY